MSNFDGIGKTAFKNKNVPIFESIKMLRNVMKEVSK